MSGFFQNLLKDAAGAFFGSDYLRDYTHADKAFHSNLYQYAPKLKFLFHCYFNINPDVYDLDKQKGTQQNFGILVRDVKLPSYQFKTSQMNQYNRKRIVQTKINYEPVQFSFYDDNSNTMAKMWAAYYTYYYNDGAIPQVAFTGVRGGNGQDLSSAVKAGSVRGLSGAGSVGSGPQQDPQYFNRNIYAPSLEKNSAMSWGYIGQTSQSQDNGLKPSFFKDITIYGFYQHNWLAYTLVNPIITSFAHDTYDYEQGNGIMKNTMTVDYETVVYNEGALDGNKPSNLVPGFGDESTYDRTLSPIALPGSNSNILGQGGLVDSAGGALKNVQNGNILGAVQAAGAAYKTFKNVNIVQNLKQELKTSFLNNLRQKPNDTRNLTFKFDNPAAGPGSATAAGAPPVGSAYGTSDTQTTNPNDGTSVRVGPTGNPVLEEVQIQSRPVLTGVEVTGKQVLTEVEVTGKTVLSEVNVTATKRPIPADVPAAKQSNSGGGVVLPPTGGTRPPGG